MSIRRRHHSRMPSKPSRALTLAQVRQRIDRLDGRILQLVNQRAMYALAIGQIKHRRKWPVFDTEREAFVLRHVMQGNRGPLSARAIRHIFQAILSECRRREHSRFRRRPAVMSRHA